MRSADDCPLWHGSLLVRTGDRFALRDSGNYCFGVTNTVAVSEAWIAAAFFAVVGGFSWLAGRAAKYVLAGT
jgi:hypothetical protein